MDIKKIFRKLTGRSSCGIIMSKQMYVAKTAKIKVSGGGKIVLGSGYLNENTFICSNGGTINVENNVTINRNSIIVCRNNVHIGAGTSIGPNVCIYDHNHKFDANGFKKDEFRKGRVVIGKNCWIAANVVILMDTIIGDNCIIGAGTVVSGIIDANNIVYQKRDLIYQKLNKKQENH